MEKMNDKEEEDVDDEGEEEEEEEEKKDESTPKSDMLQVKKQSSVIQSNFDEEKKKTITDSSSQPATKKYRFEELDLVHRPIFNIKSKNIKAEERFKMSAQEYLDTFKVSTILQDAFKMVLDRRPDNARSLFVQYLEATLKGEHILLRDHAFVNATLLNRK
jgi:hypothetical protein